VGLGPHYPRFLAELFRPDLIAVGKRVRAGYQEDGAFLEDFRYAD
jgi:hypothetical protein